MAWVCEDCGARDHPPTSGRRLTCPGCRAMRRRERGRVRVEPRRLRQPSSRLRAQARKRVQGPGRRLVDVTLVGWRVLLAEDEPLVRDATRLLLESAGARVATANDGVEALGLLARRRFHAVLCDLRMPRLDGFGFLRRLRQGSGRLATPVIAVSAFADPATRQQAREAGFDGHLAKPFGPEELFAALRAVRPPRAV